MRESSSVEHSIDDVFQFVFNHLDAVNGVVGNKAKLLQELLKEGEVLTEQNHPLQKKVDEYGVYRGNHVLDSCVQCRLLIQIDSQYIVTP